VNIYARWCEEADSTFWFCSELSARNSQLDYSMLGRVRRPVTGTPQGGVISPLLANVYLHRLDRAWSADEHGVLVRYADDGVPRTRLEVAM